MTARPDAPKETSSGSLGTVIVAISAAVVTGALVLVGVTTEAGKVTVLVELVKEFGVPGIVFVLWYLSDSRNKKTLETYREDTKKTVDVYREDTKRAAAEYQAGLAEVRQLYKNNVHLVEGYEKLAADLKDIILLSATTMTGVSDAIKANDFCPLVREATGRKRDDALTGRNSE